MFSSSSPEKRSNDLAWGWVGVNCRQLCVLSVVKCFGGKIITFERFKSNFAVRKRYQLDRFSMELFERARTHLVIAKENLYAQAYRNSLTHLFVMEMWILINVLKMPLKGSDECQFFKSVSH